MVYVGFGIPLWSGLEGRHLSWSSRLTLSTQKYKYVAQPPAQGFNFLSCLYVDTVVAPLWPHICSRLCFSLPLLCQTVYDGQ
jgi:hypothetical protein